MSAASAASNAEQAQYWNEVAGPRRIAAQSFIENRNRESNELLLARLDLKGGERVLEIGCGTGPTSERLAAMVGSRGRVTAVDISAPMLDVARRRVAALGFANAEFVLGDAQVHPFQPAAFDLATSRMGVMFFADPVAAFANIRSALKPGGRFVFACWASLAENPHWLFCRDIAARHLGPPAPRPAREPGPHAFGDPDYLREVLTAAGFTAIAIERAHPVIHGGRPEEEARQAVAMGPTARLLEKKMLTRRPRRRSRAISKPLLPRSPKRGRSASTRRSFWSAPAAPHDDRRSACFETRPSGASLQQERASS